VSLFHCDAFYRHSRIKYYLKDRWVLRIETVAGDTYDLGYCVASSTWTNLPPRLRASTTGCWRLCGFTGEKFWPTTSRGWRAKDKSFRFIALCVSEEAECEDGLPGWGQFT
jgi:hypothetical protein